MSGTRATHTHIGATIPTARSLKAIGREIDRLIGERLISERSGLADLWLDGRKALAEYEANVVPIRMGDDETDPG